MSSSRKPSTIPYIRPAGDDQGDKIPVLVCAYAPDPERVGQRLRLDPKGHEKLVVGRSKELPKATRFDDPEMSRKHAELALQFDGSLNVSDLDSRNGTFVDGTKIGRDGGAVRVGSVVRIGSTLFRFIMTPATPVKDANVPMVLGVSDTVRAFRHQLGRAVRGEGPVLLQGEEGAELEKIARLVAEHSRPGQPIGYYKPADQSRSDIEGQLFGQVTGTFTDTHDDRPGLFVVAAPGTLYIEDVLDLPFEIQERLALAIQTGAIRPRGAERPMPVDVRVIVSSRRPLAASVQARKCHPRLEEVLTPATLVVPNLRSRPEDVPSLVVQQCRERLGRWPRFKVGALSRLMRYTWPGNMSELRSVVDMMLDAHAKDPVLDITPQALGRLEAVGSQRVGEVFEAANQMSEQEAGALTPARLEAALIRSSGKLEVAAEDLRVTPAELTGILATLGIDPTDYR